MTERFRELAGETAEEAMALLGSFKTLQMATASATGEPEASYAPFVRTGDNAFYICVSDLSRHTGHLVANGRASVLIVDDESASPQLFTRRRLVFECRAEQVERGSERWHTIMDAFERKFGVDVVEDYAGAFGSLTEQGLATVGPDRVELSEGGILRVDQLLPRFYDERYRGARYT